MADFATAGAKFAVATSWLAMRTLDTDPSQPYSYEPRRGVGIPQLRRLTN